MMGCGKVTFRDIPFDDAQLSPESSVLGNATRWRFLGWSMVLDLSMHIAQPTKKGDPPEGESPFFVGWACLVDHDQGVPVRVGVDPGGVVFLHIDAAVTAVSSEGFVATHIVVGELGAGAEVDAPPGIMDVEAAPVVEDGVVNRRRRIPVGRAGGIT